MANWSEHRAGELDDLISNPAGTWPFFQAIVEWPKKPTCCYSNLSSTTNALETSGDDMNLHRCHLKNTAPTTNGRKPTINITALNKSYRASEPCRRLPTCARGHDINNKKIK